MQVYGFVSPIRVLSKTESLCVCMQTARRQNIEHSVFLARNKVVSYKIQDLDASGSGGF